jgi:hypothetical protein
MGSIIFAVESGGDVHMFQDEQAAASYLEPQDVEQGEYEIYLEDGTIVEASVARKFLSPSRTVLTITSKRDPHRLRKLLVAYLGRLNAKLEESAELGEVVRVVRRSLER